MTITLLLILMAGVALGLVRQHHDRAQIAALAASLDALTKREAMEDYVRHRLKDRLSELRSSAGRDALQARIKVRGITP